MLVCWLNTARDILVFRRIRDRHVGLQNNVSFSRYHAAPAGVFSMFVSPSSRRTGKVGYLDKVLDTFHVIDSLTQIY